MKILYAASKNSHAAIQLHRIIKNLPSNCIYKIAAYKKYNIENSIDWTLDCLTPPTVNTDYLFSNNKYLEIYEDQIKSYKPDLVISDCEYYTSYIALKNNYKLWHVSSKLVNKALFYLYKKYVNLHKNYSSVYENNNLIDKINEMIMAAEKNFCYSHLVDLLESPLIDSNYSWMRPYYEIGYTHAACRHEYLSLMPNENYQIIEYLSDKSDAVMFSKKEIISNQKKSKNILQEDEYRCNLGNCEYVVCDGNESLMSDSFYNNKKTIIIPDFYNKENIFMKLIYKNIYGFLIDGDIINPPEKFIKEEVKLLHQEILK